MPRCRYTLPIGSLRDHLEALGKGPVIVYCEVGQRGHTATALLHELGITARNLDGGYMTWSAFVRAEIGPNVRAPGVRNLALP